MCPLKREQARREMQQWVMRRLLTADCIVEIGRKSRSWIKSSSLLTTTNYKQSDRHAYHRGQMYGLRGTWPIPLTFWPQGQCMPSDCHVYPGLVMVAQADTDRHHTQSQMLLTRPTMSNLGISAVKVNIPIILKTRSNAMKSPCSRCKLTENDSK